MTPELPQRKPHRLPHYDYAENGVYFVTICCVEKRPLFGKVLNGTVALNRVGRIVQNEIERTGLLRKDAGIEISKYVVMPNHVHLLIELVGSRRAVTVGEDFGCPVSNSVPTIVRAFKAAATKQVRAAQNSGHGTPWPYNLWQSGYYDHIIRNHREYLRVWQYIEENPAKWSEDCYFDKGACSHDHS